MTPSEIVLGNSCINGLFSHRNLWVVCVPHPTNYHCHPWFPLQSVWEAIVRSQDAALNGSAPANIALRLVWCGWVSYSLSSRFLRSILDRFITWSSCASVTLQPGLRVFHTSQDYVRLTDIIIWFNLQHKKSKFFINKWIKGIVHPKMKTITLGLFTCPHVISNLLEDERKWFCNPFDLHYEQYLNISVSNEEKKFIKVLNMRVKKMMTSFLCLSKM